MSGGQMEIHGRIENWQRVKALLFQEKSDAGSDREEEEGDWGNDWGWKEDEDLKTVPDSATSDNWIRNCVIANSPMAELLVLARGKRAVFFSSEWDTKNNEMKYTKSFEGIVSQEEYVILHDFLMIYLQWDDPDKPMTDFKNSFCIE